MRVMVLQKPRSELVLEQRARPTPSPCEVFIRVEACGVCRTDLHVVDDELPNVPHPIVPGHEIVGRIEALGADITGLTVGERVGVPWLGGTCRHCAYCLSDQENLCDRPTFTGYTRDGGYASHVVAESDYVIPLDLETDPVAVAPLLCAGLIGWRCLQKAGPGRNLGLYGFGAAAHIIAQVARWQGRRVFAFTRSGDVAAQDFARACGAEWAGASDEPPPEQLDCAIILAPVGALVPLALKAVRKGGRVVCGGIHMTDIPSFPYRSLWEERELVSVANLTRADGHSFFAIARAAGVRTESVPYPLEQANAALADLREGRLKGAAVLVP
ncbi:zinc-dependent alcohol dehydrogenase family protein [Rhodoligotrophos ferricapiens]|uniref:zinc-dependent alcohol dehydrogenase family protein n=1 Tax=Rhodoligotrophos ferricapiens TaxID=3069264 RepID=UPI00315D0FFD